MQQKGKEMNVTSVSGSRLGRFLVCPSSAREGGTYNPTSPEANLGSAAHEVVARVITGGDADIPATARVYGVDSEELAMLYHMAMQLWDGGGINTIMASASAEVDLRGEVTHGRADLLQQQDGNSAPVTVILDWDFGRVYHSKESQLMGYLLAAIDTWGWPEGRDAIIGIHARCREGEYDVYEYTYEELEAFRARLKRSLERVGKDYGPSHETCIFCPHKTTCEAYQRYTRVAVDAMATLPAEDITTGDLVSLYPKYKELKTILGMFEELLNSRIFDEQEIHLDNGHKLVMVETNTDTISAEAALPILRETITDESALYDALKISKSKILNAVAKQAPRGQKAAEKDMLMSRLRDAGAVKTTTRFIRREVKA